MNARPNKDNKEVRNWYAFQGPLGEVLHNGRFFFAWKEGRLLGAYTTLEEAMESLRTGETAKDTVDQMKRFQFF
jgi:hypothetical protein